MCDRVECWGCGQQIPQDGDPYCLACEDDLMYEPPETVQSEVSPRDATPLCFCVCHGRTAAFTGPRCGPCCREREEVRE